MMASAMKVEIMKKETILPSSPTPQSFKLSLLDQLCPAVYTPLILFYTAKNCQQDYQASAAEHSQQLKTSLSEALVQFYPFSGRIKDGIFVHCNNDGVEFLEARISCRISDILEHPVRSVLKQFVPKEIESTESETGCLLLVQATFFQCGGVAIGVSISHKLADAATIYCFMKHWSGKALGSPNLIRPELSASSILPPILDLSINLPIVTLAAQTCAARRFLFTATKISLLRAKCSSPSVQNPTRVEAVSALIWKCGMKASRSQFGSVKTSVLSQTVNIRKRTLPPISDNCLGNLVLSFAAKTNEEILDLQSLVNQLRRGKEDFSETYAEKLREDGASSTVFEMFKERKSRGEMVNAYIFTSWCKFGLYETDFGWGKPKWMSVYGSPYKNIIVMMDASDGEGIEAWVSLTVEEMAFFEGDKELLEFASLNPNMNINSKKSH